MKKQILSLIIGVTAALMMSPAFGMETNMNDEETYALASGAKDPERLTIQNEALKKDTEKHLKAAGLSAGQVVWDIGCGNGVMFLKEH